MHTNKLHKSALAHVLLALIPYSHDNVKLVFTPNQFFYELARTSKEKEGTLRAAFLRARKRGLISQDSNSKLPNLTMHGLREIQPFIAKKLSKKAELMIIFDIPENQANARRQLRSLLKIWEFKQIQKSVWATDYDYVQSLKDVIEELGLGTYVELYECAKIFPSGQ